jgi:streptogramin lyase
VISRFGARGPGSAKFSAGPVGLAATATNVYSVDGANPFVSMFSLNGVFGTSFPGVASTLTTPIDIAAAPDGSVYVVDGRRTTIAHFTATGSPLASVPLPSARAGLITPHPSAIDVDSHGRLIVPDTAQKVVWVLDGKGRQLARVGAGLLQVPSGVTAAGTAGDFYVVDRAAGRVLHFRVPA